MATKSQLKKWANEARAGDRQAAEHLFQALGERLRAKTKAHCFKSRRLAGRIGPTEVVQSVFRRLVTPARGAGQPIADAEGYMFRMCVNRVLEELRRIDGPAGPESSSDGCGSERREARPGERGGDAVLAVSDGWPTPSSEVGAREEEARLIEAVERLAESDQALLALRCLPDTERPTWEQLAPEFGETPDVLKKRYAKLLGDLRTALGGGQ